MTETAIQHEHQEFIDTILWQVKTYSRLVSMSNEEDDIYQRSKLIKEQEEVMADIENSLYRRLDEVGDSE
tara:strand:- start:118 stop:327 length:210 start_codon:yes stop_codon:yes gene_type:complete